MKEKSQPQKRFKMAVIFQTSGLKDTGTSKVIKQKNKKHITCCHGVVVVRQSGESLAVCL